MGSYPALLRACLCWFRIYLGLWSLIGYFGLILIIQFLKSTRAKISAKDKIGGEVQGSIVYAEP